MIKEVKKLSLNGETLQLSKNEQVFEQVSGPISNFKSLMMLINGICVRISSHYIILNFIIHTLRKESMNLDIYYLLVFQEKKLLVKFYWSCLRLLRKLFNLLFFGEFGQTNFTQD